MNKNYDAIVIGSGFGGTMTARQLVNAGMKVLMIERGQWVQRGPHNWGPRASLDLTPHYDDSTPYKVLKGGNKPEMGVYACVGGPSVFYGGVSFRFRKEDFNPPANLLKGSDACWPIDYDELEPWYTEAESLLDIAGDDAADPTAPPRSKPFPQPAAPLAAISQQVNIAAESLGLHPFPLPLAINYRKNKPGQQACISCTTCDTFACAVNAKNDLATVLIPVLLEQGMVLLDETIALQILEEKGQVTGARCKSKTSGEEFTVKAPRVILAAGALGSPHLLLASELEKKNPGGQVIGHYLMRHVNAIVFGIFPGAADKEERFHKQLAILDFYLGKESHPELKGKLGSLQQMPTPPAGLVENAVPGFLGKMLGSQVKRLTGLLAIAEDQPQYENKCWIDFSKRDQWGYPRLNVVHQYSPRDKAAMKVLTKEAAKIMKAAGAWATYTHHIRTFSHAVGTVRMGENPETSALDENCAFRGVEGLWVVDGSFMPTSAAVNPSLTIAANALRVGARIAEKG
ncbi:MAG: hypothetical protein CMN32_02515 [Saprospirales bacterium]|nr:hypothetical protein [Saprospirales bacterium]